MYTITESSNTLRVCVDLIQGQLARKVAFNLSYQHITTEGIIILFSKVVA